MALADTPSPASLAKFDRELSALNGKAIGYLPDDAVLALLPWSAVTAVGVLPGAPDCVLPVLHNVCCIFLPAV